MFCCDSEIDIITINQDEWNIIAGKRMYNISSSDIKITRKHDEPPMFLLVLFMMTISSSIHLRNDLLFVTSIITLFMLIREIYLYPHRTRVFINDMPLIRFDNRKTLKIYKILKKIEKLGANQQYLNKEVVVDSRGIVFN